MNKLIRILLCCVFFSLVWACDDDDNNAPDAKRNELSLGSKEFKTLENITPFRIPVVLSAPAENEVTVTGYVKSETNAKEGVDYTFVSKEIVIPMGKSSGYFEVEIKDNPEYTPDRVFEFEIVEVKGAVLSSLDVCRVTISSDEGLPVIGFKETLVSVGEDMQRVDIMVALDRVWKEDIPFRLRTLPELSTAIYGEHYLVDTTRTYVITAGDTAVVIPVTVIDDWDINENRYFELGIYENEGSVLSEVYRTMKITIVNDEEPIYVCFDKTKLEAVECEGPVWIPVRVKGQNKLPVKVTLEVRGGTAVEGKDYKFETRELTFDGLNRLDSVKIDLIDNSIYEADRTLQIGFASIEGATLLSPDTLVNVKINNDDFDYEQLYEQLMGDWTVTLKYYNGSTFETKAGRLSGGLTPEEEDANYLKRFVLTVSDIGGNNRTINLNVDYDIETGKMTIPMLQATVEDVSFNNKSHPEWDHTDLVLFWFNGSNFITDDTTPIEWEWDKAYKTCTWKMAHEFVGGRLCPTGTTDLSINVIDYGFGQVVMTRNE